MLQLEENYEIDILLTDSRKATLFGENAAFFAIKGANHDGHDFVQELYKQGVRNFVIEKPMSVEAYSEANILLVPSVIMALQKIAEYQRSLFNIPVIGITGSNGKTIVKEWLFQMLNDRKVVLKSPKSYNSQLGVPLSVWELNPDHELAIFEAGISTTDEMPNLESIIKPTVGIFTNIGSAHEEGFDSIQEKVREKLKLFVNSDTLIYCKDHELIDAELKEFDTNNLELFSWSFSQDSDVKITDINDSTYQVNFQGKTIKLKLPYFDLASRENLFHCISYLLHAGMTGEAIQEALNSLHQIHMRLEFKKGINGCYVIDDTYNNDLAGLEIALQFLQSQNQKPSKTVILSDILQSSMEPASLYDKVGMLLKGAGVKQIIGIGPDISAQKQRIQTQGLYFDSTDDFLQQFSEEDFANQIVLVKGARVFEFERITSRLVEKLHETVLEIDLDALTHNLNFYRKQLQPSTKLMIMVKALAYGSGSSEISNLLEFHKVNYLAVAYTDEGIELRKNGIQLPIMVMNPKNDIEQLLKYKLEPEVFSLSQLQSYQERFFRSDGPLSIHLNLNTGMNRLGIELDDVNTALNLIENSPEIELKSVFTHLAGADSDEHNTFSISQLEKFERATEAIEQRLGHSVVKHALNSAGIMKFPDHQFDMVRLGIGLHGFDPAAISDSLLPVSRLKTVVSQVRQVMKGETVGYSRKWLAEKDSEIATIAIGYADGYSRAFSNGVGKVWANGNLAKVVGGVCMDMTMIDVTGMDISEGDEVVVFGSELPIQSVAQWIDTIPYEILTNVSDRVKRVYFAN